MRWDFSAEASKRGAVWSYPISLDAWLPALEQFSSGACLPSVLPPKEGTDSEGGRQRGREWSLIPAPCPIRGGGALDRGDRKAVSVPLPGSPASEPQAHPRTGSCVHRGHRRHQADGAEGHRTAGEAPEPTRAEALSPALPLVSPPRRVSAKHRWLPLRPAALGLVAGPPAPSASERTPGSPCSY